MGVDFRSRKWLLFLALADCILLILWYRGLFGTAENTAQASSGKSLNRKEISQNSVEAEGKKIALTFDDGPNDLYTEPLLDGLKERNVKATFFLIGNEVLEKPEITRRIAEEGHMIGNHSFYHVDLSKLSEEEARMQIERTNEVIYEVTGQYPQLIRPPFGKLHPRLVCDPPMAEVLWTIDSRDWELDDVGTVVMNVLPKAEDNAIILMHDASATSVAAALSIVDSLLKEGYTFVTLDEILFV
nr:polysaccharide deacetylase family protein [Lachnospiraceae bacterium]